MDGSSLPTTRTEYVPVETSTPDPDQGGQDQGGSEEPDQGQDTTPPTEGGDTGTPDQGTPSASGQAIYTKVEVEALDTNWILGSSLMSVSYTHLDVYKRQPILIDIISSI